MNSKNRRLRRRYRSDGRMNKRLNRIVRSSFPTFVSDGQNQIFRMFSHRTTDDQKEIKVHCMGQSRKKTKNIVERM